MTSAPLLRRFARGAIPLKFRQEIAQVRRLRRDRKGEILFTDSRGGDEWPCSVQLTQPVMPSAVLEAKLANLRRGASLLTMNLIAPGELWSFWNRIGKPTEANGFLPGRNIVDGQLTLMVGGGLCQLSSLIYHLSLLAGLHVEERHHHSVDIYREEDRFTPLGADATVVWGFKDLRLRNPHAVAISIGCFLEGDRLRGEIRSQAIIPERNVSFVPEQTAPDRVNVQTIVDGELLCETRYVQRQGIEYPSR